MVTLNLKIQIKVFFAEFSDMFVVSDQLKYTLRQFLYIVVACYGLPKMR